MFITIRELIGIWLLPLSLINLLKIDKYLEYKDFSCSKSAGSIIWNLIGPRFTVFDAVAVGV